MELSNEGREIGETSVSRRTFLTSIPVTVGFSAASVHAASSANNQSAEIVTLRKADGSPEKIETVPQKWINHEQKARSVANSLKSRFMRKKNVESVGIGPSNTTIGGKPGSIVEVNYKAGKSDKTVSPRMKQEIPSAIDGIPIRIGKIRDKNKTNCVHTGDYSTVWGGDSIKSSNGTTGTAGYFVIKNGNRWLLTANHVFGGFCNDPDGMYAYQGGRYMGKVLGHHRDHDWVVIEDQSSKTFSPNANIWMNNGGVPVKSWVTESGLAQFKSNNISVYQQGASTGLTIGTIRNYGTARDYECSAWNNGVEITTNIAPGDSGGPMFMTYNNRNSIGLIGLNSISVDRWPNDNLGQDCDGENIEPNSFGHPTWRFVQKDFGGQYTIATG